MEEIVDRFLKKGKLLTPEALDYIKTRAIEDALLEVPGVIITRNLIEKAAGLRIMKNLAEKKTTLTVEDIAYFYKIKFEKIRDLIQQKTQKNFVSLNKLDTMRQESYVVGIVKDIRKNEKTTIELEDTTGTVQVLVDEAEDVELDDVVAFRAAAAGKILYGHQTIFADIPLRKPATGQGKGCFISDLHLNEAPAAEFEKFLSWIEKEPIDFLFVAGDIGDAAVFEDLVSKYCREKKVFVVPGELDKEEEYPQTALQFTAKNIISLSNPAMIEVNGLNILMVHSFDQAMLKKRYLGKAKQIAHSEHMVLDEVPDIVHHGHSDGKVSNYKSVTIVCSGSLLNKFSPVVIDFATREVHTR